MRVLVFGSLNIDRVYTVPHMVRPGETLSSTQLQYHCGGKGLNQSIALARAGLPVCHAGKIGTDGAMLTAHLRRAGVDAAYVLTDPDVPSGHAVIQVDPSGENSILVYPGANAAISSEMVQNTLSHFTAGDFLLLQNEISCLGELIRQAKERGMTVALNPSPISDGLLQCESLQQVDWFILNELEGAQFAGSSVPDEICDRMLSRYPQSKIVLTLGGDGAVYADGKERRRQPAYPVRVVDTTAAGDTFTGYFFAGILRGSPPSECLRQANMAAALAVGVSGASTSIPTAADVAAALKKLEPDKNPYPKQAENPHECV